MNRVFTICLICVLIGCNKLWAQSSATQTTQPYGKIDRADLEMKDCDFEKDANAEVLFDKGYINVVINNDGIYVPHYQVLFDRHIRIKIFNEKGNGEASVRIPYWGGSKLEGILNVQAETINLNNGKIEFTNVDKKEIYTEHIDKYRTAMVFTFPNVQPGSVVELKYLMTTESVGDFPDWYFQSTIPTRYSQITTTIPSDLFFKKLVMVNHPFVENSEGTKSMANIPSFHDEPLMTSKKDNLQRILFEIASISVNGLSIGVADTWQKVNDQVMDEVDFGQQFNRKLADEEIILDKAKTIKTDDGKIAYIFNEVKDRMKWNDFDERYTNDGTKEAWVKKAGNSTEINLALYHLLHKAGLNATPMLVSTKENGKVYPTYTSYLQFNKTVVYIPVDSNKYYLLDATDKYNTYNDPPSSLLNGFGLSIDKDKVKYDLVFLEKTTPVKQIALINAEIKPEGKVTGTVQLSSFGYNRATVEKKYKTDGEEKYIDYLRNGDNNLKISSINFENMQNDTLPLTQNINFNLDLAGSDDTYIYFNPNLFVLKQENPFLNEHRFTDIDFGYRESYSSSGIYKEPAGYKVDAIPGNISMTTPDNSIRFKRIIAEQDGMIVVRYLISYNKAVYFKEEYPDLREFFKKMNEMMNEQIVFKKN